MNICGAAWWSFQPGVSHACGRVSVVQPWCGLLVGQFVWCNLGVGYNWLYIHIHVGEFVWCDLGVGYNWLHTYLWVSLCGATLAWITTGYAHTCG